MRDLERSEQLNPLEDTDSRNYLLSFFNWTNSTLHTDHKQAVEDLLLEFHKIFAGHRFDIGMNADFKVQLTLLANRPAYSQSLPAPINLKDYVLVELALLHLYGIITTLLFSKYASPIMAQKKPNKKLRLLLDFRKTNTFIADDYSNIHNPVSTLTDAAQHMAEKTCSANFIAPKRIIAFNWPTSNQSNSLHSILQVEHSHTVGWHND